MQQFGLLILQYLHVKGILDTNEVSPAAIQGTMLCCHLIQTQICKFRGFTLLTKICNTTPHFYPEYEISAIEEEEKLWDNPFQHVKCNSMPMYPVFLVSLCKHVLNFKKKSTKK